MTYSDLARREATQSAAMEYSEGLRKHMLRVYNYLGLGLGVSGLAALAVLSSEAMLSTILGNPLLTYGLIFAPLIMLLTAGFFVRTRSLGAMQAFYWAFCAVDGMGLGLIMYVYLSFGGLTPIDVSKAFFITAAAFGGLSLFAYTTKKDMSGWINFLVPALIGLIIAMIVHMFIGGETMGTVLSVIAVLLFSALIAWETQRMKQAYIAGRAHELANHKLALDGALTLYISVMGLFQSLLSLMGGGD